MTDAFKAFQDQFTSAFKPMDVPAAFRDFAEKGVQSYREGFEKLKASAEQTSDLLEGTYSTATKGRRGIQPEVAGNPAHEHQFGFRLLRLRAGGEECRRGRRAVVLAPAHPVRDPVRAGQGTRRSGAEGGRRELRADQGRRREDPAYRRLIAARRDCHSRAPFGALFSFAGTGMACQEPASAPDATARPRRARRDRPVRAGVPASAHACHRNLFAASDHRSLLGR